MDVHILESRSAGSTSVSTREPSMGKRIEAGSPNSPEVDGTVMHYIHRFFMRPDKV